MDQVDLDAQSPTNKLRRGRHAASYWPLWASRVPADGTGASDSYWKANPRATHSVPRGHEQRRQEYRTTEPVTSCYSASNTYRPRHRTQTPVPPKPPHVATSDQTYRVSQHSSRTARNKLLTTNNVAVVRKPYKDEPEEYEETKYGETGINYAEENADEDAADDVDEDQEEAFEFNEKDYEEQEADDEVDDESDAFQAQLHRVQQKLVQKAPTLRTQHQRHAEHHRDFRKAQHQQSPVQKMYPDQKQPRFYSRDLEPQQPIIANDTSYGDAADTITDEDRTPPLTPTRRSSSRRTSETHHGIPPWISARKSLDRNRDRVASPMIPAQHQHRQHHHQHQHQQHQQIRGHRIAKPEIESLMMPAHQSNATTRKCSICRGSTAPITAKVGSSTKGNCRLQEYRAFTIKGPRGEDAEAEEQIVCPHCARRYNLLDDFRTGCDPATHEAPPSPYFGRPHRSQAQRSSAYNDYTENNLAVDEMLAPYTSGQPRSSITDCPVPHRERTRHSMQSARSPFRGESYYEP
ncbi:basic-leucine zipper transcription factor A-like [Neodiprion fabricii]|uniref:basic-leucine zipper transcription factor A-like n=1 Tax=Neodiprion fabricii TaxID=2872261 RepID=UPI001ED9197C|nr:basic-leucine zipper transcription factor A-like [Neodiprion fabricii]